MCCHVKGFFPVGFPKACDIHTRLDVYEVIFKKLYLPIGSMYCIFPYIWLIFMVNVGKYAIHGSYGLVTLSLPVAASFYTDL